MFTKKKNIVILILCIVVTTGVIGVFLQSSRITPSIVSVVTPTEEAQQKVTYKGSDGKNALELLQAIAQVKQDNSGLVVSINNREAQEEKREYWSFYVNGKLASVGPKEYLTNNDDTIEWRIEIY